LPFRRGLVKTAHRELSAFHQWPPMILLRSLAYHAAFYLWTAFLAIVGLPILLMNRNRVQDYAKFWTSSAVWLLEKICGTKVEWRGLENLPRGACLIASKHQSALETLALTTKGGDFGFILKRELMGIPVFGWYLKGAGQVGIDRGKPSQALADLARQAREAIAQGRQLIIFPEGTRKAVGSPPDYKAGIAYLYRETGAVCVPVALNTGLFWPRRSRLIKPGKVTIAFLAPIAPGLDKKTFIQLLERRIETATSQLIEEALAADPSLRSALKGSAADS
jgi:1-acyl-sn-glycerol-3-phosphate acyltransferase